MSRFFPTVACGLSGILGHAQPLPLSALRTTDGLYRDTPYGAELRVPISLGIRDGMRWGELQTTLFVTDSSQKQVWVIHYQVLPQGIDVDKKEWLLEELHRKVEDRKADEKYSGYEVRASSVELSTDEAR